MKRIKHFALSLLTAAFVVPTATAQTRVYEVEEYTPTIYMIAVGDELQEYDPEVVRVAIIEDFVETKRHGFQQAHNPQFIFSTRNNRFSLGIGGMVNLRTSYDLKGAVGNIDFVPYDIPMQKGYANQQRVMMDASTSRLFMKAIVNSPTLGRIHVYTDMDFRGGEEFTYIPRLRSAYVNLLGFTIGRDVTTFCDLAAAPTTIDFQGPNAYNFAFNEMIRYEHSFVRDHLKVGIAAEMPSVNATYGENFEPIYQRVPDGIAYVQYAWGANKSSHVRLSGVVRDMYLHNKTTGENTTEVGWGAQFSGHIEVGEWDDEKKCAVITDENLVDITKDLFVGTGIGNKRKILFCGSDMLSAFSKIKSEKFRLKDTVEVWNLKFKSWDTDFGEVLTIHHELFDVNGMSDCGFAMDPEYLSKKTHISWARNVLDLQKAGIRRTDAVVIQEVSCLYLRYAKAHARMKLAKAPTA